MTSGMRHLFIVSRSPTPCGVEAFTRLAAEAAGHRAETRALTGETEPLGEALARVDGVVLNFPVVAWKKEFLAPVLVALAARLRGKAVRVMLHEWGSLNWKRRIVLAPVAFLATSLSFSAPEIAAEFAASPVSRFATRSRNLAPIPPNLARPEDVRPTELARNLAAERAAGRMVIGHFGSIYPKKNSLYPMEVLRRLLDEGVDARLVYVGSFIKAEDRIEDEFNAQVARLGLGDRVTVTGYVRDDAEIYALFDEIDVFLYKFEEGLTSRRGSVLAAALSGAPVVVNAPARPDSLKHHGTFQALIGHGALRLVAFDAGLDEIASAVRQAGRAGRNPVDAASLTGSLWADVVAAFDGQPASPNS